VYALMEHVRRVVAERCGVTLRTEVRLLGFDEGKTGAVQSSDDRSVSGAGGAGAPTGGQP
jgi:hypothetical protein